MANRQLKILLVIPLYNHAETVCRAVKSAMMTGYPVLVVDDGGSSDGFKQIAILNCFFLKLVSKRGKGAAILAGARFAADNNFDTILTLDADGLHDPLEVEKLIREAEKKDYPAIIIGARQMNQDTVSGSSHFGRKFSDFWVRLECGHDLSDTQSSLRLYPVRELLLLNVTCHHYDFEIEILVKAVWAGVDVGTVDISFYDPPVRERVNHIDKIVDNWRLIRLHSALICRRLLPLPHNRLVVKEGSRATSFIVKKPWQTLKNFCRESASPFWLAVAVWFGIFLGSLPLIACHTLVIIYVAYRFHLNKVAAVAASQFCMPPLVPVLCIEAGYYLRNGRFLLDLSWERWLLEIHHRIWDWFLGSLMIGPVLGLFGATVVYWLARRFEGDAAGEQS